MGKRAKHDEVDNKLHKKQRLADKIYAEQTQSLKWLQLPEQQRDVEISRAMEKEPMRELVRTGVHMLITYLYKSRESKIEFSVNLFGKHVIRLGEKPENIDKAEEILRILQLVGYSVNSRSPLPHMSQMSRIISLYSPEVKSKGEYNDVHKFLMQASIPHSSECRKAFAMVALEKAIIESLEAFMPKDLIEYIIKIVKSIPEDAFHGRDVDDYRSQYSKG